MHKTQKPDISRLIINIIIPLAAGALSALITKESMNLFSHTKTPPLTPPELIFPIVWTLLYILMGISAYIVQRSNVFDSKKTSAMMIYGLQLIVNFIWPIIFFNLEKFFSAFVCLLVLLVLVIIMTVKFYKINSAAGLLQIPYIVWLCFAGYLNASVYLLNR